MLWLIPVVPPRRVRRSAAHVAQGFSPARSRRGRPEGLHSVRQHKRLPGINEETAEPAENEFSADSACSALIVVQRAHRALARRFRCLPSASCSDRSATSLHSSAWPSGQSTRTRPALRRCRQGRRARADRWPTRSCRRLARGARASRRRRGRSPTRAPSMSRGAAGPPTQPQSRASDCGCRSG